MNETGTTYEPYPLFERPLPSELIGHVVFDDRDRAIARKYGEVSLWSEKEFNLQQKLYELPGPTIEIGGPTRDGYMLLDDIELPQPLFVSNIQTKQPVIDPGELDFMADGCKMPVADNSVGLVLGSGITGISEEYAQNRRPGREKVSLAAQQEYEDFIQGRELGTHFNQRIAIIKEVSRILVRGGLMIFTVGAKDMEIAKHNAFEPVQIHTQIMRLPGLEPHTYVTAVLQKQ